MRPFFPFYGSKWNMARYYPEPIWSHTIEPFAGAAGYSTFYEPASADLFDADPIIAGIWRYLLTVTPKEIMALPELPNVGDNVDDFNIPQEARWLIGFWLNRGSASPKKSRTAYSARSDRGQLNWGLKAKERIAKQLPLIEFWTITEDDFEASGSSDDATWFIDPPYVDKGKFYRVKFSDHERLGRWAKARNGQVIVCEGPGADWLDFRPFGTFKSSTGRALERVWMND
jgi:site-specific DNA-adenine methylase